MSDIGEAEPTFTVIIATYKRGLAIQPTIDSVLQQTESSFELLVISDGPADPELKLVCNGQKPRVHLLELADRFGSQSGPNNLGIANARGRYIAYLGHDDIWAPDHLASLLAAFRATPSTGFAVSGCLFSGPPGSDLQCVTGMFNSSAVARTHFFPPSSFAHRRDLPPDLMVWPDHRKTASPLDSALLLHAAEAGVEFSSTRRITVLKFNSAFRYLSYLQPDIYEQVEALKATGNPESFAAYTEPRVREALNAGTYMTTMHPDTTKLAVGEIADHNASIRGLVPERDPLTAQRIFIEPSDEARAFDWHYLETDPESGATWRWSGPNPRPRLLLPALSPGLVRATVPIVAIATEAIRDQLAVAVNGKLVSSTLTWSESEARHLLHFEYDQVFETQTVVEFRTPQCVRACDMAGNTDQRMIGFAYAGVLLERGR